MALYLNVDSQSEVAFDDLDEGFLAYKATAIWFPSARDKCINWTMKTGIQPIKAYRVVHN